MNRFATLVGPILLAATACAWNSSASWPKWARELAGELHCGMSLEEVKSVTSKDFATLEAGPHPWLGQHYVTKRNTDLWLRFNDRQRLEWVTLSRIDGWKIMATRLSPRQNLCTDELTFQIRLDWTVDLEGATVYLDGQQVRPDGGKLAVSAGNHELRIEKNGYEPVIRHLDLSHRDRGDQRLDLTKVELRSVENL